MQLCRTRIKKIPKKDTASARDAEGLKKTKQEREIKRKGGHG